MENPKRWETEGLLSEDDAAQILLITKRKLRELCREGSIECVQSSPRRRGFTQEQVKAYIKRQTVCRPKPVDRKPDARVASLPKSPKGGDSRKSLGGEGSVSLTEEMRQLCQS